MRAPKFAIVEQLSVALGVHVDGLLGLSAIDALYVDAGRGVLRGARGPSGG